MFGAQAALYEDVVHIQNPFKLYIFNEYKHSVSLSCLSSALSIGCIEIPHLASDGYREIWWNDR